MTKFDNYRLSRVVKIARRFGVFSRDGIQWLDLGCNDGTLPKILLSLGCSVTGIDSDSRGPLDIDDKCWKYLSYNLDGNVFPFESHIFDVVSGLEVIEHINDTDKFLDEIYRVLKPGGYLVLSTPNICMLKNRFRVLFGLYPHAMEYRKTSLHHLRLYNLESLLKQLKGHNFRLLSAKGMSFSPCKWLKVNLIRGLSEFLSDIFPTLCSNLVILARRE